MRIKIVRIAVLCGFLAIAARLAQLQIVQGEYYFDQSQNNIIRVIPINGLRGRVLDRNGVVLADNRVSFDVMVIPQELKDKEALFQYLSQVLKIDKKKIATLYQQRRSAPFAAVSLVDDIDKETAFMIEENKFLYPGLWIRVGARRYYPFKENNAHVLGYVGKVNQNKLKKLKEYGYTTQSLIGYSGVEEFYDQLLRGEDGGVQVEVNNRGQQVRILGIKESSRGADITVSLDQRIQQAAMDLLRDKKGSVIFMNLEDGEILCMVSSPSYNPDVLSDGKDRSRISGYFSDPSSPLLNRATGGVFPPGSVFKIPMAIAALEEKKISPGTSFDCPGYYQLGRRRFHCSHVHGTQNLLQGIAHSCNVYFFNVGLIVGPETISKYVTAFGLGSLTGIDLPAESKGHIPLNPYEPTAKKKTFYKGDILNFSIGQGDVMVTPIQLLCMMAHVQRPKQDIFPHLIKTQNYKPEHYHPVFRLPDVSEKTYDLVRQGLREVVADPTGTAHLLSTQPITVHGKTGTAQTSGGRLPHAWFVGYCPDSNPPLVFCVFLEHGGSSYYAVSLAKDLFKRLREEKVF